ncbi:hypothetical protein BP6252_08990 [Coleophoma cylindrospora]|uniref:Uncharacterized protein n=1 Tax=Coleophoma cylindrospora TaxID=1849047 RepID=A0A3D8R185_9HELO|nr:hypothetical protein BP6252_08990 [Coleophoma cylindrospora]
MNISAPLRFSYLRESTYNPSYAQNTADEPLPALQEGAELNLTRTNSLSADDEKTLKEKSHGDRISVVVYEVDPSPEPVITQLEKSGPLNRIKRMCTVFPYKDISWQVAVIFVFTNTIGTVNSFFGLLPLIASSTNFRNEKTIAAGVTLGFASTAFLCGIALGLLAAFNTDRGTIGSDKSDDRKLEEGSPSSPSATYKPALMGSDDFVWKPTMEELKTFYLPNPAFQAGLAQLVGAMFFTIANIASFPGVINKMSLHERGFSKLLVSMPTLVGGIFFFGSAMVLMVLAQDKWYKPKLSDINWLVYFLGATGALAFLLNGAVALMAPQAVLAASLFIFIGRWTFWLGSLLQWYVLMEFYPSA